MTKSDLRNGMFGKLSDGDIFVVVGDKLIYEGGAFDDVSGMNEELVFTRSGNKVVELYEAACFQQIKRGDAKTLWQRGVPTAEEAKVEDGKITISEDDFFNAVTKANEEFMRIGKETGHDGDVIAAMMGLQNIAFGGVIGAVLFGKEIK